MAADTYSARHLSVLEGLEAVRKRPGMYIGSTDTRGLMHCVWEIIDNAVDEAIGGFGDTSLRWLSDQTTASKLSTMGVVCPSTSNLEPG